jgi:cytochrome b subunit of formate dehydrogenase
MAHAQTTVRRYSRAARWFHAVTYVTVLLLLGTGWWLLTGHEGRPSVAARITGVTDTSLHQYAGWALVALAGIAITIGIRATATFVGESLRHDPGDVAWLLRWPRAALTGRFAWHDGHFDPGQRIANLVLVLLLAILAGTGIGLTVVSGGPWFVWLHRLHRWSTYLITPVLLGHIVIATGVLPGYRGVAHSMHLGGRLPVDVANRIWPGWLARHRPQVDPDRAGHRQR